VHCNRQVRGDPVPGNSRSGDDVTSPDSIFPGPRDDVTNRDDVTTGNRPAAARRLWIDDVYVTGLLPELLLRRRGAGQIHHVDMAAAYCKSDKMAAVYRHATEWYKYLFTQVADSDAHLYRDTWNALIQRATNSEIPSPSVIRPGHLADDYIPLSVMLQLARNITQTTTPYDVSNS